MINNPVKGNFRAIKNHVIVSDMEFGEQISKGGIVISTDDGKTRGVYPRWGKVYKKGPENTEEYSIGDWVLIEHGRWTRGFLYDDGEDEKMLRMVETSAIMMYSDEKPDTFNIGVEYKQNDTFTPEQFSNLA